MFGTWLLGCGFGFLTSLSKTVSIAKDFTQFGVDVLSILRRTPTTIYVRESHVEKMGKVQDVSYEILNVLEFNR